MVVSIRSVFVVREANVTSLAQRLKVPIELAQHVNDKHRQNADALLQLFKLDREFASGMSDVELDMSDKFDVWYDSEHPLGGDIGSRIDSFLKKNPAKKKELIDVASRDFSDVSSFLKKNESYGKQRVVARLSDGYVLVEVDPEDASVEGTKMQHCGMAFGVMYSIRDSDNNPHVTIEIQRTLDGDKRVLLVQQLKGKQNRFPDQKYWKQSIESIVSLAKKEGSDEIFIHEPHALSNKSFMSELARDGVVDITSGYIRWEPFELSAAQH